MGVRTSCIEADQRRSRGVDIQSPPFVLTLVPLKEKVGIFVENNWSYPSITSSILNERAGDLVLVVTFGTLGVPPRFGDVLAPFPA